MNEWLLLAGWLGVFAPMALGALGSMIGCSVAGQAAIGAIVDSESGFGKYIGVSVIPSSQIIYGIVVMFSLNQGITPENAGGILAVGLLSGIAMLIGGVQQGLCCATAIHAAKAKPEIFGVSLAPAAIIEGFNVFVLVFALVVGGQIVGV
jgi:V/A-type H+-transporting ATPase subunit K